MKVVFDTNVLFAALVAPGLCAKLLRRGRLREFELVICPPIREELGRALAGKLRCAAAEVAAALALVDEAVAALCPSPGRIRGVCRDPDDGAVLDCAVAAAADYLVTGDDDLLVLKEFQGVPIVTPREFELQFGN